MKRLHLVDGTYELFRQHFSKRPEQRLADGTDVKATVGLVWSMLALLHETAEAVTHIAIAFDNPIRSFRNDLFDGYKTEEGVDPDLLAQFDPAEDAMRAIGIPVWSMDQWECDDALATGAARFADAVDQVRIMSPDKDLGQCVRGQRVVQIDRLRKKEYDEAALIALRGIPPTSIPDLLGLVGDTADGIPGLAGFGEKSAAAVLARYLRIEDIPDDVAKWDVKVRSAPVLAATLAAHRDEAMLYKKLATLIADVPLNEDLDGLEWKGVPRARFEAWCERMQVTSLRAQTRRWAPDDA